MKKHIRLLALLLALLCAFSSLFVSCEKEEDEETEAEEIERTEEIDDETDSPDIPEETTSAPETEEVTTEPETTVEETTEHVHEYATTENAATCTAEGSIISTCSCGDKKTETLQKIDHNFVDNKCSMCGLVNVVVSQGLEFSLNDDGKSYSLLGIGTCTDTEIIIPSEYNGMPVTAIATDAFKDNKTIKSLEIPESVKVIGFRAFYTCEALEKVTFSEGLTEIQGFAFGYCNNLNNITLPDSLKTVGTQAFTSCKKLVNITLSDGIIEIGAEAFVAYSPFGDYNDAAFTYYGNAKYLGTKDNPYYALIQMSNRFTDKECEIHKDTKVIVSEAFSNAVIEKIIIPNGVKAINSWAFFGCPELKSITIEGVIEHYDPQAFDSSDKIQYTEYDNGYYLGNDQNPYLIFAKTKSTEITSCKIHPDTKQIAGNAFRSCASLKSVEIHDNITVLGDYAFGNCTALTSIKLPKNIDKISKGLFYGCTALVEYTIPDHITEIGQNAFTGCTALEKITIPGNVKVIDVWAFSQCSKLKTIYFEGPLADWDSIDKAEDWDYLMAYGYKVITNEPVILDPGASEGLVYTKNYKGDAYYVESIGTCRDTDIVISSSYNGVPVINIYGNAFKECTNIQSVKIPSSITIIGENAFVGCTSLKNVVISEGVQNIYAFAFKDCTALEEIYIPSSVSSMGNAFVGCTSLKSIKVDPNNKNLRMVGNYLLQSNDTYSDNLVLILGSYDLPNDGSIKGIGSNVFYEADIKEIVIPEGVLKIDVSAFMNCTSLTKVTLPESLKIISGQAFNGCTALKELYIPKNVNNIISNPFKGCTSLESIVIDPENTVYRMIDNCIVNVEKKILVAGCYATGIPSDGSVTAIGTNAFEGNKIIENLIIPDSVTDISYGAFSTCENLKTLVIGNGITNLNGFSLYNYKNLESLKLGSGITVIEKYDIMSAKNLTELTLSKSITKIEASSVTWCDKLVSIKYEGTVAEWNAIEKEDKWDNGSDNYTVYCSDGEIKK